MHHIRHQQKTKTGNNFLLQNCITVLNKLVWSLSWNRYRHWICPSTRSQHWEKWRTLAVNVLLLATNINTPSQEQELQQNESFHLCRKWHSLYNIHSASLFTTATITRLQTRGSNHTHTTLIRQFKVGSPMFSLRWLGSFLTNSHNTEALPSREKDRQRGKLMGRD